MSAAALEDLEALITSNGLPDDTRARVKRSLRTLEQFPRAGREFEGHWAGRRFWVGPWPWMPLIYELAADGGVVNVITIQDGRSAVSATSS